jgi:hypothetical protein
LTEAAVRLDPAKARLLAVVLLGSGAALVLFGAALRGQSGGTGAAVIAAGLADITVGIALLARNRR